MELSNAVDNLVNICLGLKKTEELLIIVDEGTEEFGKSLEYHLQKYCSEIMLLKLKSRTMHGEEPPITVAQAMGHADVILAPTTKSLTHTEARRAACTQGARIATMPDTDLDMFIRTLNTDFTKMRELTQKLSCLLTEGVEVEVSTALGTSIRFSIHERKAISDLGELKEKGSFGNLPAGEAYIAPVEGTASGIIVFDSMMAEVGLLNKPIKAFISEGRLIHVEGGLEAHTFKRMLDDVNDPCAFNLAELGVGTNERAMITNKCLEAEKVLGTVHFAFGDNASMGGSVKVPIHLDGVVSRPNLRIDGCLIMQEGRLL